MPLLFEYGECVLVEDRVSLEQTLLELWRRHVFIPSDLEIPADEPDRRFQPFLKFDGNRVWANNYVGFIQNGDDVIEIYPKVFRGHPASAHRKDLMLRHIFYWFGYCKMWRFPFDNVTLDPKDVDNFPELIINMIANELLKTITNNPLSMYQPVAEVLQTPRGSIDFKRYISNSYSRGNPQNIDCEYEPFVFDNKANRIIKYCSRVLLNQTRLVENVRILQDVTFILSDVEDVSISITDLDSILLNPFFSEYISALDACRLILSHQLYSNSSYDLSQWCLLFPMEYIFEDFLAGFLQVNFADEWQIEYQKSDMFVSNLPRAFQMQHDIFLTSKADPGRRIIVDAKYKLRDLNSKDSKKGVAQPDLYQMLTYALKRGCDEVLMLYPNVSESRTEEVEFVIESGFPDGQPIRVTAQDVPFWSFDEFPLIDQKLKVRLGDILSKL